MQAPLPKDAGRRHLVSCPECGAYNGLNATDCWQCEAGLPPDLALGSPAGRAHPGAPNAQGDGDAGGGGASAADVHSEFAMDAPGSLQESPRFSETEGTQDAPPGATIAATPATTPPARFDAWPDAAHPALAVPAGAAIGASTWVPIDPPTHAAANDDRAPPTIWPPDLDPPDTSPEGGAAHAVPSAAGAALKMLRSPHADAALPPALQALSMARREPAAPRRWAIGGGLLAVAALVVWWMGPRTEPEMPTLTGVHDAPPGGYAATRTPMLGREQQPITLESAATAPREVQPADAGQRELPPAAAAPREVQLPRAAAREAQPPDAAPRALLPPDAAPARMPAATAYSAARVPALGALRPAVPEAARDGGEPSAAARDAARRAADRLARAPAARTAPRPAPPVAVATAPNDVTAAPAALAVTTPAAPAAAAPCTPQVLALGLCAAAAR